MSYQEVRLSAEPGVEREKSGRIIKTGWPIVPVALWQLAQAELMQAIQDQIQIEELFARYGTLDSRNAGDMASGRFNLGGIALAPYIADELIRKMNAQKSTDIELCDVGGGNGHLLQVATYLWTGSATSRLRLQRSRLKITMTTLYKHQPDLLDLRREIIDNLIIGTGIELPTNDLYNRFDILVAQNSVFFWSNYPELALTNLYKMCRPGGVVFATAPVGPITVAGKAEIYLVDVIPTSQLFVCDVLEVREEYAAFKLTKVIEPAAHTVR